MAFGSDRSRFTDNEFSGKRYKLRKKKEEIFLFEIVFF